MGAGAIWQRELTVTQNEDFKISLGYATPAPGLQSQLSQATPIDFSMAVADMTIAETATTIDDGGTALLELKTTTPTTNGSILLFASSVVQSVSCGQIVIIITAADTAALPVGKWYFDILVAQSGFNVYYAAGPFIVLPTLSRIHSS